MTDKPVFSPEQMAREVDAVADVYEMQELQSSSPSFARRAEILRAAAKLLRGEPQIGSEP